MTCGKDVIKSCQLISNPPIAVPFGYQLYEDDGEGRFYLLRQGNLLKSFKKNKQGVLYKLKKTINWYRRRCK